MANLFRSAKSGSDWTQGDLDSYNIHRKVKDTATLFGILDLPQPHVDPEILNVESADNMTVDKNAELITLLDIAMVPTVPEESAVDDFTVELFRVTGYVWRKRVARTHKDIPLLVCEDKQFVGEDNGHPKQKHDRDAPAANRHTKLGPHTSDITYSVSTTMLTPPPPPLARATARGGGKGLGVGPNAVTKTR